jgi:uracil-DNA glycosylase
MDEVEELGRLARATRERLEWLQRGGVDGLPRGRGGFVPRPAVQPVVAPATIAAATVVPTAPASAVGRGDGHGAPGLRVVREDLGDCRRCKLHPARKNIVFGVGNPEAALVFVGEGPGSEEDRIGEPFVGPAGQLLDKMIAAMGLARDDVYICNVVKCRPPGNRNPEPDEIEACEPFLARQLAAIRPRMLVALGGVAAKALLNTSAGIMSLRGQWKSYQGIPLMPTFHPAFLLRAPDRKREAWSDLQQVMAELDRLGIARRPTPGRSG